MLVRRSSVLEKVGPATAAGLLALGLSGCLTPPPAAAPAPAPPVAAASSAAAAPAAPAPQPPPFAPAPASLPGRMKIALVSSWLWVDGEYVSPLDRIDYLALHSRLRGGHEAPGAGVEAKTLELEVDPATDWQTLRNVLSVAVGHDRLELTAGAHRFGLLIHERAHEANPDGSTEHRTVVLLRNDAIAVREGQRVPAGAAPGAEPDLEKLLEVPRRAADAELEGALRGVCSRDSRCSDVVLYLDSEITGAELLRVLDRLDRAAGTRASPFARSLSLSLPPDKGQKARPFGMEGTASGRLPPEIIRQIVRKSYGVFRACYERGLGRNPNLRGLVTVRFIIGFDGSVIGAVNGGSALPDDDVVQCIVTGFLGLRFPAPIGGIVTVQYPIQLQPG